MPVYYQSCYWSCKRSRLRSQTLTQLSIVLRRCRMIFKVFISFCSPQPSSADYNPTLLFQSPLGFPSQKHCSLKNLEAPRWVEMVPGCFSVTFTDPKTQPSSVHPEGPYRKIQINNALIKNWGEYLHHRSLDFWQPQNTEDMQETTEPHAKHAEC